MYVLTKLPVFYWLFSIIRTAGIRLDSTVKTRSVSIEEWCSLAGTGEVMPIRIQLDGISMQPLVRRKRDYVTVVPVRRELKKGDIVLFLDKKTRYCVHRVNKIDGDRIRTLGDNCFNYDGWTDRDKILGLVVSLERNGKKYNLDSDTFRFYGKVRMSILPLRQLKHFFAVRFRALYRKLFRKNKGVSSDV